MLERISSVLISKCLITKDQPLLLGVSGGPDSLCLLDVLHQLGYQVIVAHYNHMLRDESNSEEEEVRKLTTKMNFQYITGRGDIRSYAELNNLSLEEAARISRYGFMFQQAEIFNAQAVSVGHTADDQVETVLMHLLRGAGLSGLRGMSYLSLPNTWSQSISLVRPLLGVWREEIQNYLIERNLNPTQDTSNLDVRFYRNRLRHEVIPYLESINPHLCKKLWLTAEILREDYSVLENLTETVWDKCIMAEGEGFLALAHAPVQDLPLSLQRMLLRKCISILNPGLRDVDFESIERGIKFLNNPSIYGRVDLVAGLYLLYEKNEDLIESSNDIRLRDSEIDRRSNLLPKERVWLATWGADLPNTEWPQIVPNTETKLVIPGEVLLEGHWRILAERLENSEEVTTQFKDYEDPFQAWLDLESLQLPLLIRTRLPGDRLQPLGMENGSIKVSDLMINCKIPRRSRERWPLIISGEEIAWVPGLRIAQGFQIKETTKGILHLSIFYQSLQQ